MTPDLVLAMIAAIAPNAANTNSARELAVEVARVVDEDDPIFDDADTDAAELVVVAWYESTFVRTAVGDGGRSYGYWQLQRVSRRILADPRQQAEVAYDRLRASASACPQAPLAPYVSGSCTNRAGQRISAFRMREIKRIRDAADTNNGDHHEFDELSQDH